MLKLFNKLSILLSFVCWCEESNSQNRLLRWSVGLKICRIIDTCIRIRDQDHRYVHHTFMRHIYMYQGQGLRIKYQEDHRWAYHTHMHQGQMSKAEDHRYMHHHRCMHHTCISPTCIRIKDIRIHVSMHQGAHLAQVLIGHIIGLRQFWYKVSFNIFRSPVVLKRWNIQNIFFHPWFLSLVTVIFTWSSKNHSYDPNPVELFSPQLELFSVQLFTPSII